MRRSPERDSGMECLRLLAMVMIVAFHMMYFGNLSYEPAACSFPRLWSQLLLVGGKLGVDLFVMLSGYYLVMSRKGLRLSRVLKLWSAMFFYALVIFLVNRCTGRWTTDDPLIWLRLLPMMSEVWWSEAWWFANVYILLYLAHPFLNVLLHALTRRQYLAFLLLQAGVWSVIPLSARGTLGVGNVLEFAFFYSLAAFIRLHAGVPRLRICLLLTGLGFAVTYGGSLALSSAPDELCRGLSWCFLAETAPGMLLMSLGVFLLVARWRCPHLPVVNKLAAATFGVYLIHDNSTVRDLLWNRLFSAGQYQDSLWLIPYSLLALLLIYSGCTLIEWLRQWAVERWLLRALDPLGVRAKKLLRRALAWAERRLQA